MYYEAYFELQEAPFSISPDPRYLYLTQNHREALAHLLYGVSSNGGFVLLTGEIGAGKTTVCQCLLEQLPDNSDVAYILNPKLAPWEFLATICDELGIPYADNDTSLKHYIDLIHRYLLDAHGRGRNTVLMVDEAQNLSTEMIEHLRLLTNLETREKKLLQIMLVGQPELRDKIALPEMQQMAQRITARYHLGPLSKSEVAAYVRHRLKVAGAKRELFSQDSLKQLWKYTGGVPRLINIICDRALLGTYTSKGHRVELQVVDDAAAEVLVRRLHSSSSMPVTGLGLALVVLLVGAAFFAAYFFRDLIPVDRLLSEMRTPTDNQAVPAVVQVEAGQDDAPEEMLSFGTTDISGNAASSGEAEGVIPTEEDRPMDVTIQDMLNESTAEPGLVGTPSVPESVDNMEDVQADATEETRVAAEAAQSDAVVSVSNAPFNFPESLSGDALTLSAFNALFHRWEIEYLPRAGEQPCEFALGRQLACLAGHGTLETLWQLDRPVLLTLYDGAGKAYPAALIGLSDTDATLVLGGELKHIPLQALSRWWYGEYQLLWQLPPGYQRPLARGSDGTAVVWLLQQLGDTMPVDNLPQEFDHRVEQQVKLFQLSHGLIPDGVVGPRTIIALNNASRAGMPRLTASARE
ncbi:MAG: general secretion pathway protein GspA [Gammaproteobacteria bacterium]|nr:MAG: general secretion pathway protein GspA [Gammaproteobacteria bacterium]